MLGVSSFAAACVGVNKKKIRFILIGDDPEDKLRQACESAAARWSVATGIDVQIVAGPKSIRHRHTIQWAAVKDMYLDANGIPLLGSCDKNWSAVRILISTILEGQDSIEQVVVHEMGHAIARTGDELHTQTGVMRAHPGTLIDYNTLMAICSSEAGECSMFSPESPPPDPEAGKTPTVDRWQVTDISKH